MSAPESAPAFHYAEAQFHAEGVALDAIAQRVGTPFYAYSRRALVEAFTRFDAAFAPHPHLTCYSMKALSNLAVLQLLARQGSGFDVVSGGELRRVLHAGADPQKIVFSGVAKTDDELAEAIQAGILMINIESLEELQATAAVAERLGRKAPIAVRVNPDIDPKTHPYITTGLEENKFGLPMAMAREAYAQALRSPWIDIVGIDFHIGSQLTELQPMVDSLRRVLKLVRELREQGVQLRYIDMGGGLGITYDDEKPPAPERYGAALLDALREAGEAELGLTLVFEPGRVICGNAGVLVTRVIYVKETGSRRFVICDAGMNDLLRPSLYSAYHKIVPVREGGPDGELQQVDLVGPICETGDFIARGRALPELKRGDLVAVLSAGAYGHVMSSNYNSRGRPPEILVDGEQWQVVRERERYEDLVRGERLLG